MAELVFNTTEQDELTGLRGKEYAIKTTWGDAKAFVENKPKAMNFVYGPIASLGNGADLVRDEGLFFACPVSRKTRDDVLFFA